MPRQANRVSAATKKKRATARGRKPAAGRAEPATAKGSRQPMSYLGVFRATPLERIDMIRRGIPASEAKRIFAQMRIGQGAACRALNLPTATLNKKAKQGGLLSPQESERVVGFARLVGQVEAMVEGSGDGSSNALSFDTKAWMARWLGEPLAAFGGLRPADLVDTIEGQSLVAAALAKAQSGAYA